MEWILSLVPWWVWAILVAIAGLALFRLLGFKGALAALAIGLPFLAYRKGRDDQRTASGAEFQRAETKSKEMINVEEQGALAAGDAAARSVRERRSGEAKGDQPGGS
jgi:hypothetical protein